MKTEKIFFPILLGLILCAGLLGLFDYHKAVAAAPTIRYVSPQGLCNGAEPCYATVQDAVDAASGGDEIRIASGTYTDVHARTIPTNTVTNIVTQVVFLTKTLSIQGGYALDNWNFADPEAHPTRLDANGKGRVIYIGGGISLTIAGLQITGGDATGLGGYLSNDAGGGIFISGSQITIRDNDIFSNTADQGAGIYVKYSKFTLENSTLDNNQAADGGGGIYFLKSSVSMEKNLIRDNMSQTSGGGVYCSGSPTAIIKGNTISGNKAYTFHGGGSFFAYCDDVLLRGNIVTENSANWKGSGLGFYETHNIALEGNLITHNAGASRGGGIHFEKSTGASTNDVILENDASLGPGIYNLLSELHISHITIAKNLGGDGSGIYNSGTSYTHITNAIFYSQTLGVHGTVSSTIEIDGVLWYNNGVDFSSDGMITATNGLTGDPAFADDGYHLTADSAAINHGVESGVFTDFDSQARPNQGFDLGADEYWPLNRVYLPLIVQQVK